MFTFFDPKAIMGFTSAFRQTCELDSDHIEPGLISQLRAEAHGN
jgi:hypothetical protein